MDPFINRDDIIDMAGLLEDDMDCYFPDDDLDFDEDINPLNNLSPFEMAFMLSQMGFDESDSSSDDEFIL